MVVVVLVLLLPGFAYSEPEYPWGWYVRCDIGFANAGEAPLVESEVSPFTNLSNSHILGGGVGYALFPGLRTDVTLTYRSGFDQVSELPGLPAGRAKLQSFITLLSLYIDIVTIGRVCPYGGFGIGFSHNRLKRITIEDPVGKTLTTDGGKGKTNYSWQLTVGAGILIHNRILFDAGYHRVSGGKFGNEGDILRFEEGSQFIVLTANKFRSDEFIIGLQFSF